MLQLLKNLFDSLLNLFISFIQLLKSPFQSQPCKQCSCEDYNDEQFFAWMKERSTLTTYPSDMLAERIIDKPLKCSRCKCPRETHGNLKQKILTCDMMPNGGAVYIEKTERERLQRRRRRFATHLEENQPKIETMQLREGSGTAVQQGDQIECHYDAFITSTMEKFETSRDGDSLRFTIGSRQVVPGLEQGVIGSQVGSKQRIFVPAALAYGPKQICGERFVDITFDVIQSPESLTSSMFQGHYGAALLISAILGRPIPLPILFLLSQVQDVIFVYLAYAKGIEKVDIQNPRTNAVNPFELVHFPYSHGLFSSILLAIIAALVFRGKCARLAAAATVASHWVLDLIVHEPDLDVCFPFATCPKVGLCVWRYLYPSIIVECAVVGIGAGAYLKAINEPVVKRRVAFRLVPFMIFMVAMTALLPFVPPPATLDSSITVQTYYFYAIEVIVAWAVEKPLRREMKRD